MHDNSLGGSSGMPEVRWVPGAEESPTGRISRREAFPLGFICFFPESP